MTTHTSPNYDAGKASKRKVLITGCSDGGLGAALAIVMHKAGLEVYATSRNIDKMSGLASLGIQTLTLDIQSEESIAACVEKLPALDILVNNAGAIISNPVTDINISQAKELFDLNVWAHVAVTQACIPLLLKSSNGMIVNQTSCGAAAPFPFFGVYCSSKAALSMISQNLRLELQPFSIKVVELRSGDVKTNIFKNSVEVNRSLLPESSIYAAARDVVNGVGGMFDGHGPTAEKWAKSVVKKLLKKNPPAQIWKGESALMCRIGAILPLGVLDNALKKGSGLDAVQKIIEKQRR